MANNITRTQTFNAEDGNKFTFQDVDGNGTFDKVKVDEVDAVGNEVGTVDLNGNPVQAGTYEYLDDNSANQTFQALEQDYGLTVENPGTNEVLSKLDPASQGELQSISSALTSGQANNSQLQGRWADFVSQLGVSGTEDVNALVQEVLRESYTESTQDLDFYAQKVQFYNDLKSKIRDDLASFRKVLSNHAGDDDNTNITFSSDPTSPDYLPGVGNNDDTDPLHNWNGTPAMDDKGNLVAARDSTQDVQQTLTKQGLSDHVDDLEEQLNSVGDDSQLANVDLQNMLQKQQQTLQMMSNVSKMLYDTAMAVVRKISS